MGCPLYLSFDGWTNVKGKPLISVLAVSTSGDIFLFNI